MNILAGGERPAPDADSPLPFASPGLIGRKMGAGKLALRKDHARIAVILPPFSCLSPTQPGGKQDYVEQDDRPSSGVSARLGRFIVLSSCSALSCFPPRELPTPNVTVRPNQSDMSFPIEPSTLERLKFLQTQVSSYHPS